MREPVNKVDTVSESLLMNMGYLHLQSRWNLFVVRPIFLLCPLHMYHTCLGATVSDPDRYWIRSIYFVELYLSGSVNYEWFFFPVWVFSSEAYCIGSIVHFLPEGWMTVLYKCDFASQTSNAAFSLSTLGGNCVQNN